MNSIRAMGFFWNALYAGFNAVQSFIILIPVSRKKDLNESGIVTIGFTIAVLAYIVATYGIRNYQVTDLDEKYSFSDYFWTRIITVLSSFFCVLLYEVVMVVYGQYSLHKGMIIMEIVTLKLIDAFESVYVSRFQQNGRLDVGARTAAIRTILSTLIIYVYIWMDKDITIAFILGIMVSVFVDLALLPSGRKYVSISIKPFELNKIRNLLIATFSLFIGTALHNYMGNAPKYLVDRYMNDSIQAISGYIMMPMFVITVLNSFIMNPTVKTLGDVWNSKDMTRLRRMIMKHGMIISIISVIILLAGYNIGLTFMSWIYRVDLNIYKREFAVMVIGGALYTLSAYGIVILTIMRKQNWIMIGCIASVAACAILGSYLVKNNGLMGASQSYIITNMLMLISIGIGIIKKVKNDRI